MGEIHSDFSENVDLNIEHIERTDVYEKPENANSCEEVDGMKYYTDDNGDLYKVDDRLLGNMEYCINGNHYETNANGEIVHFEGDLKYNPENERDEKAQIEAAELGGKVEGDDGGHLIARILDGSQGIENIVPMRDTINRGDYKIAENEMSNALHHNKDVHIEGSVIREDSTTSRPTKIEIEYSYDDVDKVLTVDNVKESKELMEDVKCEMLEIYDSLNDEINDMIEDGHDVSVTSVLREYDTDGNLKSMTVSFRDETDNVKEKRTFSC